MCIFGSMMRNGEGEYVVTSVWLEAKVFYTSTAFSYNNRVWLLSKGITINVC